MSKLLHKVQNMISISQEGASTPVCSGWKDYSGLRGKLGSSTPPLPQGVALFKCNPSFLLRAPEIKRAAMEGFLSFHSVRLRKEVEN